MLAQGPQVYCFTGAPGVKHNGLIGLFLKNFGSCGKPNFLSSKTPRSCKNPIIADSMFQLQCGACVPTTCAPLPEHVQRGARAAQAREIPEIVLRSRPTTIPYSTHIAFSIFCRHLRVAAALLSAAAREPVAINAQPPSFPLDAVPLDVKLR